MRIYEVEGVQCDPLNRLAFCRSNKRPILLMKTRKVRFTMFNNINNVIRTHLRGKALALSCVALLGCALVPKAAADEWDKKTVVTISAPVEIPGKVLPSGTYVFKLMDSVSDRNIVQIFDQDEKRLYATILAIPNYRLQPTGKTVIHFEERPAGTPEAIKEWFYPGDVSGEELVYPRTRAVELAKETSQNTLSTPNQLTRNITAQANRQ